MKRIISAVIVFSLLLTPFFSVSAQSLSTTESTQSVFDMSGFPQWAKDIRRWEIVTFGVFPFSLFAVTFTTDMIRWYNANGMDFSAQGRRYAPWPLKSAGAVELSNEEFQRNLLLAAGLSMTLAFVDFFIVLSKRNNERRRLESSPPGSVIITRIPQEAEESDIAENGSDTE